MLFSDEDKILVNKFYLQSVWEKLAILNTKKYQNLGVNNKIRGDLNLFASLPYLLHICRIFEFLIFQGSVATCLRRGVYCHMGFVANFIRFPVVQKL